jgi:hypothetical protein
MTPLVIGEPGACVSFARRDDEAAPGWSATAAYEVGPMRGALDVQLIAGGVERWVGKLSDQLEQMHQSLAGEANLHTLEDEISVHLECSARGKVSGDVVIRMFYASDPRDARLTFRVNLDQSYLPLMVSAVRSSFPGL